jgi:hypothetical protein
LVKKHLFLLFLLVFLQNQVFSQTNKDSLNFFFIKIDSITVEGNKITRKPLILRELGFRVGDSIPAQDLEKTLAGGRNRIVNLAIFNDVNLGTSNGSLPNHIIVHIKVRESWYWFPSPVFELVDRNFNVWWKEFNRSLKRTNYGGDYTQYNVTGHADVINLTATAGYNQRFSVRYRTPTINKKQTIGIQFAATYSRTREVAVTTLDNKLVFFSDPDFYAIRRFIGEISVTWRPALFYTHSFLLEHRNTTIADTIANEINPFFFGATGVTQQRHNSFVYSYSYDNRDIRAYPMHGWNVLFEARQNGLLPSDDLHLTRLRLEVSKYFTLSKRFSLETAVRGRYSLPRSRPPYFNNSSLGYGGDLVRGYEYFVMDGLDLGVFKTSFRTRFFDRNIHYPKIVKKYCARCKSIETQAYLSVQNDIGYAKDPWYGDNNALTNRFLYAYGLGLDLVFYKRIPMQVAWMNTVTGQSGIYVRTKL